MTDDIVILLRKEYDYFNQDGVGDYELLTTAADEIERLRAQVADLKNLYRLRSQLGDAVGR